MCMTREEFWTALDAVCAAPDKSESLLAVGDLLRDAYNADLPLLIACTRTPGRIHHSYTFFDASHPDLAGNRYLICFSNPAQATHMNALVPGDQHSVETLSLEERFRRIDEETAASSTAKQDQEELTLAERFRLIDEGEDAAPQKKARRARRKKAKTTTQMWKTSDVRGTATVSTKQVLDYMRRNRAVGGLIFNVYDEKRSIALPKFMIG